MRLNRGLVLSATTVLMLSQSLSLPAQAAMPTPGGLVLSLTGVPASATRVLVELESPLTRIGVPKKIEFYPLAVVPTTGKSSMTAVLPASRLLHSVALAQHGNVNLLFAALSATRSYSWMTPAHIKPTGSTTVSVARIDRVSVRRHFADSRPYAPCVYDEVSSSEVTTRIGELHVTDQQGVTGYFNSGNTADNNITLGISASGANGSFSADGYSNLSNSLGVNGGFGRSDGFLDYVDGHIYYGKFEAEEGSCIFAYIIAPTSSVGDAFPGSQTPPAEPYSRCEFDPNGYAIAAAHSGHWNDDRSDAYNYGGIAILFGFKFGGWNGYTSYVNEGWDDNGPSPTFICGNKDPVQSSSILYNGDV